MWQGKIFLTALWLFVSSVQQWALFYFFSHIYGKEDTLVVVTIAGLGILACAANMVNACVDGTMMRTTTGLQRKHTHQMVLLLLLLSYNCMLHQSVICGLVNLHALECEKTSVW